MSNEIKKNIIRAIPCLAEVLETLIEEKLGRGYNFTFLLYTKAQGEVMLGSASNGDQKMCRETLVKLLEIIDKHEYDNNQEVMH